MFLPLSNVFFLFSSMSQETIKFSANNSSTCRGCMNTNVDQLVNLFSGHFHDLYQLFTSLTISHDDGLPTAICIVCKEQLESFHLFRLQCIRTHELLESKLELKIKVEKDSNSFENWSYQNQLSLPSESDFDKPADSDEG